MTDPKPDYDVLMDRKACPRQELHWTGPHHTSKEYLELTKTHRARKCPGCGLWKIWEPR